MPLINRFSRLFTADLNAVLDRIEEPEILLRQAVRDMESALDTLREQARAAADEAERANTAATSAEQQLDTFDEELDICFDAGEDELARSLVRRKLEVDKHRQRCRERAAAAGRQNAELAAAIAANENKLAAMREKLTVLIESEAPATAITGAATTISNDEIDVAFLREKQRRGQS